MSLEAQYRAVYELMYKRRTRDAFEQGKFDVFPGLTDSEAKEIRDCSGMRQSVVVQLHANDIGTNWYAPRFPATWMALQVAQGCAQDELTMRLTDSDAFELRVDDDKDGRAISAFIYELLAAGAIDNALWLPELMRYERMLRGHWDDGPNPRVQKFEWDVGGIRESLLEREFFPLDEKSIPLHVLMYKDDYGVSEIALRGNEAGVMRKLIMGEDLKNEPAKLVAKCRRALRQIQD